MKLLLTSSGIKNDLEKPFYCTDDETALKVVDGKIEIVGDGEFVRYEY